MMQSHSQCLVHEFIDIYKREEASKHNTVAANRMREIIGFGSGMPSQSQKILSQCPFENVFDGKNKPQKRRELEKYLFKQAFHTHDEFPARSPIVL